MSVSLIGIKMSGLRMKNSFVVLFKRSIEIQSLIKCYGNEFTILQHPSQKSDFLSFLLSPLSIDSMKCFFFLKVTNCTRMSCTVSNLQTEILLFTFFEHPRAPM